MEHEYNKRWRNRGIPMKFIIAFLMLCGCVMAQTNFRTVMVDTNGIVQRPTNFITTNRIVSVDTNGSVNNPTNFWTANSNSIVSMSQIENTTFTRRYATFASLQTQTNALGGAMGAENSEISAFMPNTNASGFYAIRLMRSINSRRPAGVGTQFGADDHEMWVQIEGNIAESSYMFRSVLGNFSFGTNFGEYPTNHAFGFEMRTKTNDNHEVRLIAHNGTTNTNGTWTEIGSIFDRHWIGVKQNKTNGQITLFHSSKFNPTNNTNATILGGPTNSAGTEFGAWDFRLETTNTNAINSSINVYGAFIDVID